MEEYDNSSDQKVSKFDSTIAVLMRLDQLWKDCHKHSRRGDLMAWNWDLDRVWMELVADAKPEDIASMNKINSKIAENVNDKTILYNNLLEKEILLRKVEKTQGKGIGYQDPLEDYIQQ